MPDYPALPLLVDDYLAATRHLSTAQHGAYLLLLIEAWRRPKCAIPDDDELLARLTAQTLDEWLGMKAAIMAFWKRDGRSKNYTQSRLTIQRRWAASKRAKSQDAAATRWNKTKKNGADAMRTQCPDDATLTLTLKESKKLYKKGSFFPAFWKAYPRKIGKKAAQAKFIAAIKSGVDPERIISAAEAYSKHIAATKTEPNYVKHPSSWLNQGCWDDELEQAPGYTPRPPRKFTPAPPLGCSPAEIERRKAFAQEAIKSVRKM